MSTFTITADFPDVPDDVRSVILRENIRLFGEQGAALREYIARLPVNVTEFIIEHDLGHSRLAEALERIPNTVRTLTLNSTALRHSDTYGGIHINTIRGFANRFEGFKLLFLDPQQAIQFLAGIDLDRTVIRELQVNVNRTYRFEWNYANGLFHAVDRGIANPMNTILAAQLFALINEITPRLRKLKIGDLLYDENLQLEEWRALLATIGANATLESLEIPTVEWEHLVLPANLRKLIIYIVDPEFRYPAIPKSLQVLYVNGIPPEPPMDVLRRLVKFKCAGGPFDEVLREAFISTATRLPMRVLTFTECEPETLTAILSSRNCFLETLRFIGLNYPSNPALIRAVLRSRVTEADFLSAHSPVIASLDTDEFKVMQLLLTASTLPRLRAPVPFNDLIFHIGEVLGWDFTTHS